MVFNLILMYCVQESKKERTHFRVFVLGARGGSRTRTPLRALAPEASESTNSTTRASGALISAGLIIPCDSFFVNTFFALDKILFLQYNKQAVRDSPYKCGCAGTGRLASLRC